MKIINLCLASLALASKSQASGPVEANVKCHEVWPSETGNYFPPPGWKQPAEHNAHRARRSLRDFDLDSAIPVMVAMPENASGLEGTNSTESLLEPRNGSVNQCCRWTFECSEFFYDHAYVDWRTDDMQLWEIAVCCMRKYRNSCPHPRSTDGLRLYQWPPRCTNP